MQEGLFQNLSSPGHGGVSTDLFLCKIAIHRAVVKLLHERDDCGDDRHGLRRDAARHPFDGFGLGLLYLKANAVYFLQQPQFGFPLVPLGSAGVPLVFVEAFQNFHYGFRGFLTYGLFKLFSVIK